jgi:DNA polymerase delta subunit 2
MGIDANTTGCFPFADKDPFIIERRPHVYFVGNQPEFKTSLVGGKLSLCIRLWICLTDLD